jgi:hypothetical protein
VNEHKVKLHQVGTDWETQMEVDGDFALQLRKASCNGIMSTF